MAAQITSLYCAPPQDFMAAFDNWLMSEQYSARAKKSRMSDSYYLRGIVCTTNLNRSSLQLRRDSVGAASTSCSAPALRIASAPSCSPSIFKMQRSDSVNETTTPVAPAKWPRRTRMRSPGRNRPRGRRIGGKPVEGFVAKQEVLKKRKRYPIVAPS